MERECDFIIINGIKFPAPDYGLEIKTSQTVSSARNTNNAFVGQKVGRRLWKVDKLKWSNLKPETVKEMVNAVEDFTVPVTFTDYTNTRKTLYMYVSDITVKPYRTTTDGQITEVESLEFNVIDCGWN